MRKVVLLFRGVHFSYYGTVGYSDCCFPLHITHAHVFIPDNDDFGMTSRDFNTLGETTLCLDIVIEDNTLLESCETFEVRVTDSNIIPSPDAATITIYDNEGLHNNCKHIILVITDSAL